MVAVERNKKPAVPSAGGRYACVPASMLRPQKNVELQIPRVVPVDFLENETGAGGHRVRFEAGRNRVGVVALPQPTSFRADEEL